MIGHSVSTEDMQHIVSECSQSGGKTVIEESLNNIALIEDFQPMIQYPRKGKEMALHRKLMLKKPSVSQTKNIYIYIYIYIYILATQLKDVVF